MISWNKVKKSLLKNILIMIAVCIIVCAVLFLISKNPSITLHPNAYRDIIRSIVIVYTITYTATSFLSYYLTDHIHKTSGDDDKFILKDFLERISPYECVCVVFTVLTIVNSFMMITNIDVPKQGVFAYIHMLSRFLIISLIVAILFYKEIIESFRNLKPSIKDLFTLQGKDFVVSSSKIFTNITILYCITMIAIQGIITPTGGMLFYKTLLIIAIIIVLIKKCLH